MAIKKSLLIAGIVTTFGVATLAGIGTVAADTNNNSLAQKIANKFNINQDEVQSILDEHRNEMKAEHEQMLEERLSEAVADGKLTEDQKTKILEKLSEVKAERESNKDSLRELSKEDRKAFFETKRQELKEWAKENGIPEESLRFVMPHHGHGGPGGPGHHQE